jgi:hypothetical protein
MYRPNIASRPSTIYKGDQELRTARTLRSVQTRPEPGTSSVTPWPSRRSHRSDMDSARSSLP